jgi:hypothetical protein
MIIWKIFWKIKPSYDAEKFSSRIFIRWFSIKKDKYDCRAIVYIYQGQQIQKCIKPVAFFIQMCLLPF